MWLLNNIHQVNYIQQCKQAKSEVSHTSNISSVPSRGTLVNKFSGLQYCFGYFHLYLLKVEVEIMSVGFLCTLHMGWNKHAPHNC